MEMIGKMYTDCTATPKHVDQDFLPITSGNTWFKDILFMYKVHRKGLGAALSATLPSPNASIYLSKDTYRKAITSKLEKKRKHKLEQSASRKYAIR